MAGIREGLAQAAGLRFRAVKVDVQPLIAVGGRGAAELIARVLPGLLAASFADALAPADPQAPVLIARIDRIYLPSYSDLPSVGFSSFGSIDSLEGVGVTVSGRQTLSTTPLRVTLPAGYSGVYYLPDIDQRRITSLCESFASWLRREIAS